jgi:hypothetical protein
MRKSTKVVIGFAAAGFVLPLVLLAFYAAADQFDSYPNPMLLLYVCPASIVTIGLDRAPTLLAVIAWLMICASNAVLYAIIPFATVLIYRAIRPDPRPSGLGLR